MAKKTSTIRVFELARELSVTSKDLIAKCEAEGIPKITNHMSTISLGLAATVREWFGGGESTTTTAVETAAPVDLAKAHAKAKKKAPRKKAAAEKAEALAAEAPAAEIPAVETPVVEMPAVERPPAVETPAPAPSLPQQPPAVATPPPDEPHPSLEQPPAVPEPLAPAASAPGTVAPLTPGPVRVQPNVPARPEVVKPAGPMLQVPSATKLAGPKIIRVESPEPVTHRRPIDRRPDAIRHSAPRAGVGVGHQDPPRRRTAGPHVRGEGRRVATSAAPRRPARTQVARARSARVPTSPSTGVRRICVSVRRGSIAPAASSRHIAVT